MIKESIHILSLDLDGLAGDDFGYSPTPLYPNPKTNFMGQKCNLEDTVSIICPVCALAQAQAMAHNIFTII